MNNTKQIIKELQAAQTFLIKEHKPEFALDNIRRAICLLKKSNAKPSVTDTIKKILTCHKCGTYRIAKCTCCDCVNSFTNPFDELCCNLHKSAKKLCKDFKKRKGVTKTKL